MRQLLQKRRIRFRQNMRSSDLIPAAADAVRRKNQWDIQVPGKRSDPGDFPVPVR